MIEYLLLPPCLAPLLTSHVHSLKTLTRHFEEIWLILLVSMDQDASTRDIKQEKQQTRKTADKKNIFSVCPQDSHWLTNIVRNTFTFLHKLRTETFYLLGPLWSRMVPYGPVWSCVVPYALVWSSMVLYSPSPVWPFIVPFVPYGPVFKSHKFCTNFFDQHFLWTNSFLG